MTTRCEVHVLGKLRVTFADGREPVTKFRTRKAALLLAYLALHPGKTFAREFLIELLWPDADPDSSRFNFNTTLSILRRQLEPHGERRLLEADHSTIRLVHEGITVDAVRFERLVVRGLSTHLAPQERRAALTEALALWEPLLPGSYEPWVLDAQMRFEALADEARKTLEALPETPSGEGDVSASASILPSSTDQLPLTFSRFFGREKECQDIMALLKSVRLVTLLGPGGVGKTRLSLELARAADVSGESVVGFERRVFVALAELATADLLLPTLLRSLTVVRSDGDPLDSIVAQLTSPGVRSLVVFDNMEHLLPEAAGVVQQLLERCPSLTILATSRQALGISAEQLYPVEPLQKEVQRELFVNRSRSVRPDFTSHKDNQGDIEAICSLLDGLPLAIELAAAWVRVLSLTELRGRLEHHVLWLEGRRRDHTPRQKSLEATLRWSWELLPDDLQQLLRCLAVFRGGWTLDAAAFLLGKADIVAELGELVDKSLVRLEGTRYTLLETIRQFAADRLNESGEGDSTRQRHLAFYLALVHEAKSQLLGQEQLRWLDRLEREHDNLRAALRFSLTQPESSVEGLALAAGLGRFWMRRGYLTEGREWFRRVLAHNLTPTRERADALHGAGMLAELQADYPDALDLNTQSLAIRRALADKVGIASSLNSLGIAAHSQRDYEASQKYHLESLMLRRELGDPRGIATALNNVGNVAHQLADYKTAQACHEESLAIKRGLGDQHGIAFSLLNLGNIHLLLNDPAAAQHHYRQSLLIHQALGNRLDAILCLLSLAVIGFKNQRFEWAICLCGAIACLQQELQATNSPLIQATYSEYLAHARDALGDEGFDRAWAEGMLLSFDETVASTHS